MDAEYRGRDVVDRVDLGGILFPEFLQIETYLKDVRQAKHATVAFLKMVPLASVQVLRFVRHIMEPSVRKMIR